MNSHPTCAAQGRSWGVRLTLTCILLLLRGLNSYAAPVAPDAARFAVATLPSTALAAPIDLAPAQTAAANSKLDADLAALARASRTSITQARALARAATLNLADDRIQVKITIQPQALQDVTQAIAAAGGAVTGSANGGTWLQAWLPLAALDVLAAAEQVEAISRPAEAVLVATTEGLATINGPAWHSVGLRGAGVKVAIIDGGFQGYLSLRGTELPASVTIKNFVDGESDAQVDGATVHGTACAEIIYDIAPQATLYLIKVNTDIDLQEAVTWAIAQNVNIISTSLAWYNQTPGDGTGFFANLVQTARNAGIFWVTAAGNDREAHWGGAFNDSDADGYHNFNGGQEINYFGPGDGDAYLIPSGYSIRASVRWDDWTAVNQNYDLYLVRWNDVTATWQTIATSANPQNGSAGQKPAEYITGVTSGEDTAYGFAVRRINSSRNVNLELFALKVARLDEIVTARSLANLADAPAAMTVAALDVVAPYPQEPYSSEGPTNGPGGTAAGGAVKPDIAGFANVSTLSYPDPAYKFNGTSAATPHVAGAAALVKNAYPAYTPAQLQAFLQTQAIDMGPTGKDTRYGYGRLYLGAPPPQPPDVSLTKRAVGSNLTAGSSIQFILTIANQGYGAASSIVITDLVPAQVTNLSYSSTLPVVKASGAAYTWHLATLAAGASGTITIDGKLSASLPVGFVFINRATITAPNDTNTANNAGRALVGGRRVSLPILRR